jgi:hypothetical protein
MSGIANLLVRIDCAIFIGFVAYHASIDKDNPASANQVLRMFYL